MFSVSLISSAHEILHFTLASNGVPMKYHVLIHQDLIVLIPLHLRYYKKVAEIDLEGLIAIQLFSNVSPSEQTSPLSGHAWQNLHGAVRRSLCFAIS